MFIYTVYAYLLNDVVELFKEAPYSFLKSRKHTIQIQNLVHC